MCCRPLAGVGFAGHQPSGVAACEPQTVHVVPKLQRPKSGVITKTFARVVQSLPFFKGGGGPQGRRGSVDGLNTPHLPTLVA